MIVGWYTKCIKVAKFVNTETNALRPVFREGLRGWKPPPEKSTSADVMNIIMAIIGLVDLKRAPECIKMHHFEGENAKIFLGRGHSPPQPSSDPTPSTPLAPPFECLRHSTPPDHISGYGPECTCLYRVNAWIFWRSFALVKPTQALNAQMSLAITAAL